MLCSRAHAAVLAAAAVLSSSPSVVGRADDSLLVLITLRDQPAIRAGLAEAPVSATLSATERDDAVAARTALVLRRGRSALIVSQAPVLSHLRQLGGQIVYAGRAFNAVAARVPAAALPALRARLDVASVEVDEPRRAALETAGQSMLLWPFWAAGAKGGAVDVAVVDTGVYVEHEAYLPRQSSIAGAVFHRAARLRADYYDFPADPDDYGGHGTFVAGTVFSQGGAFAPLRLGVAHGLDTLYNLKAAYAVYPSGGSSLLSDTMEAVDWALSQADPPEVFNYSYGAPPTADDDSYSRFWDGIVDGFGKVVTISAGNDGPGDTTVNSPGIAYNVITVGNLTSRSTVPRDDDVIASNSSRGPTPGGRRKPDLSAPGSAIWLPSHYGRGAWLQSSGTSFAAGMAAGAAALLIDAGVPDPRSVKAVLVNSADDLGPPGWDDAYGWGYVNCERAWTERQSVILTTYGPPTSPTGRRFFERTTSAPTKATLAWNRHVEDSPGGGSGGASALNDFDLHLYATDSNTRRASSTSMVDNVEQVASAASEPAVLVVQTSGAFTGTTDGAALAHGGGFVQRAGPDVAVSLSAPGTAEPGTVFSVDAAVANPGDLRGHDYVAALELPEGFTLVSPAAAQGLTALASGGRALLSWQVRAPGALRAPQELRVRASTSSYGWQWTTAASAPVTVATGCGYTVQGPGQAAANGGELLLQVTAAAGCGWSAASGSDWISIAAGATGAGSGEVRLAIAPNGAGVRTGTVGVAGTTVAIIQAPAAEPVMRRYYLAEGATGPFFDLDVVIANPNPTRAPVVATFLREDGTTVSRDVVVGAQSRLTIHVNDIQELSTGAVSTVIASTAGLPLVVERTMVWGEEAYGGHAGSAVGGPQTRWYFAEGSQGFFDTYLLLANPGTTPARVTATFLREGDGPVTRVVDVGATSRATLHAGGVPDLVNRSFSIVVDADVPIIAERAMYWSAGSTFWIGGHESAGVPAPAVRWLHAEGATGAFFHTYLLLGNPNAAPTDARVTYLLPDGSTVVRLKRLPAQSRTTVFVADEDPRLANTAVSVTVDADLPIVSERAMYWPAAFWQEAHNSFGQTETATRWGVAEGCQGGPRAHDTYILVANPSSAPARVRVTFLREQGSPIVKEFDVAPTSRFNVSVGAVGRELSGECFGAVVESVNGVGLAVERAVYWDARGVWWAAGTNATATKLP
jgi:hypothetical protein